MKNRSGNRSRRSVGAVAILGATFALSGGVTIAGPPTKTVTASAAATRTDAALTNLINAIRANDARQVSAALSAGVDVNATDANRSTPLHQACAASTTEIVRLLLDKGANQGAKDRDGFTPLMVACYAGKAETAELLLSRGADATEADNKGRTALMGAAYSAKPNVVRLLLDHKADPRAHDADGFTALTVGAGTGSIPVVQMLMDAGSDVNATTASGFTPLMQASGAGRPEMVRLLLSRGANPSNRAKQGATALLVASYAGNPEIVRQLLDRQVWVDAADAVGHTPLIGAANSGSVPVARMLLDAGANIEAQTRSGLSALMQAAYSGRPDVVQLLLDRGALVDARTSHGLTALMQAVGSGNAPITRMLLEAGADVNAADDSAQTPATWANKRAHDELLPLLRTAGARIATEKGTKDLSAPPPPTSAAPAVAPPRLARLVQTAATEARPAFHGPSITGCSPGHPFLFRLAATGTSPLAFTASGLPAGLALDTKTGIISGKVAAAGSYTATLNAANKAGRATQSLTIVCGDNKLVRTPPMGWSAWTLFGEKVTAEKVREQADWLIKSGLAAHGYNYILLDDTWQGRRDSTTGELPPNRRMGDIKALADYLHARGLKLGLYSSPNSETCAGYAGSYGHEEQDARAWAGWGIDYLKYDWCDQTKGRFDVRGDDLAEAFRKMRDALRKTDRDIVFAVTPYGFGGVTDWGEAAGANTWWTSPQVLETWQGVSRNGFDLSWRGGKAGPGHWNDPGWLLLGRIGSQEIDPHFTKLTPDEQQTQMTLWCLASAPLILSCDLTQLDPNRLYPITTALLTNDEVLAIDQDSLGKPARVAASPGRSQIWARPLADGSIAVGFFNREESNTNLTLTWEAIRAATGQSVRGDSTVRDLWLRRDVTPTAEGITVPVRKHGTVLLRISPHK